MQPHLRPLPRAMSAVSRPQIYTSIRCRPHPCTKRPVRGFTSSRHTQGMIQSRRMPKDMVSRLPSQVSMKTKMKSLTKSEISDDFGLLPQTFVYGPAAGNYPTILAAPRTRLKLEGLRIKQAGQCLFTDWYMCRHGVPRHPVTKRRMKKPMLLRERGRIARELHEKFYTALAEGDMTKIPNLVCKGLEQSSRIQIEQRKAAKSPPQRFRIQNYNGWNEPPWLVWPLTLLPFKSTRVLTDRLVPLPMMGKNSSVRQCIVRIKSTQTLDRGTGKGPESRRLEEYVVIQKLSRDGQEEPWKIWGTVKPHTATEIFQIAGSSLTPMSTVWSMFKEKLSGMTGGMTL